MNGVKNSAYSQCSFNLWRRRWKKEIRIRKNFFIVRKIYISRYATKIIYVCFFLM
jgi:hypothetical protein